MKTQNIASLIAERTPSVTSSSLLPGEIEGIETILHRVPAGDELELAPAPGSGRAFLFLHGHAVASCGDGPFRIEEIALLAVDRQSGLTVTCQEEGASFLELGVSLTEDDHRTFEQNADEYPFFTTYSECRTYREAIKSEKTVNRTLLPEYTLPRLCVGSVQTTGPDEVARHKHPMLEQLFLGLEGNDCVVTADALESPFGEFEILHIPPGSDHGVTVDEGKELHYIWIDIFRDASGMQYIADTHL
jgi:hypothetical protein